MITSFTFDKPIYRQIMDRMGEHIMLGEWPEGGRIPAVREFAMQLQVNPNTVLRAYENFQNMDVLESRRGIGYFVVPGAVERIRRSERDMFMTVDLPGILDRMAMLDISFEDVKKQYELLNREEK